MTKQLQSPSVAGSGWSLEKMVDPFTDQCVVTALASYAEGMSKRTACIRCAGAKLDVCFDFGEFLADDRVSIRYRIDKGPVANEEWFPSAEGTAVFANEPAELVRFLMRGSMLNIEAQDFRGQPHRASFDLAGASALLKAVLDNCGVSDIGMHLLVEGLRREVGLELERWGPKNISINKRILARLGAYDGALDTSIEPKFAIAVQRFYDAYISKCRDGELNGASCESLRIFWKAGMTPVMPPISAVIYERAPSDLMHEAGDLKMGE